MDYEIIAKDSITLIGIELRTTNSMGKAMIEIPMHWKKFYSENLLAKIPNRISDDIIAAYIDYENDHKGAYTHIIGAEVSSLEDVPENMSAKILPGGAFAMITAEGPLPMSLIRSWKEIWSSDLKRTYTGDFELYGTRFREKSPPEIDIYVAIE